MSEAARDQMVRGVASAKAGEVELARRYFERALHLSPDRRQSVDAYFWLAKLSSEESERRDYLTRVLQLEPTHYAARRDLALLDGSLRPDDLVDPNQPEVPAETRAAPLEGRRYVCPQCGGRLTFLAGSQRLNCSYCGYDRHLARALQEGAAVSESNYIHALVTAKGHTHPQHTPTFTCNACGASYILEPGTLSLTCPHCGSVYAVNRLEGKDLVPPQGIIPFQIDEGRAGRALREWLEDAGLHQVEGFAPLYGVYLAAWTFDLSGEAPYRYQVRRGDEWVPERGNQLLVENDLAVAASHRLKKALADEVRGFDMAQLRPYDPGQLAGWPAEAYEIPATDAAMAARWHMIEAARRKVRRQLPGAVKDLGFRSTDLLISSYRLVLLPFWLSHYQFEGRRYQAVVNGQTGAVRAEQPPRSLWTRLRRWWAS